MSVVQNLAEAKPSREPDIGEQLQYTKHSLRCPAHPHTPRAYHRQKNELKHNILK